MIIFCSIGHVSMATSRLIIHKMLYTSLWRYQIYQTQERERDRRDNHYMLDMIFTLEAHTYTKYMR